MFNNVYFFNNLHLLLVFVTISNTKSIISQKLRIAQEKLFMQEMSGSKFGYFWRQLNFWVKQNAPFERSQRPNAIWYDMKFYLHHFFSTLRIFYAHLRRWPLLREGVGKQPITSEAQNYLKKSWRSFFSQTSFHMNPNIFWTLHPIWRKKIQNFQLFLEKFNNNCFIWKPIFYSILNILGTKSWNKK